MLSLDVAKRTQALCEGLEVARGLRRRTREQIPDLRDLPCRLRHGEERRYKHTQGEYDEAPDSAVPHSHFLESASCRPSSFH